MLLADRVVIVSGVGPGLGHALALACVDHGARVVLVARTEERVTALVSTVTARGGEALAVKADASNTADTNRVVDAALERFGRVDGLINNAAVIPPLAPIAEVASEVLEQSMEGNFLSAFHLSRAVIPSMLEQGHGSIVMVGSAVVRHPKVGFGVYNVGKHAMVGMARSLALELGPAGIRVNTLAPGKIAGERLDAYFEERAPTLGVTVDELRDRYTANIALRRLPAPDEYADAAVFLLSDLSRAVTGHILDANGGEYFD